MRKILLTLGLLAVAGTAMASELSNAMSVIAYNSKGEVEHSVTSERVETEKKENKMISKYVNFEYRYIELKMKKSSNAIDKFELFPADGKDVLGMEFNDPSEITKFVSTYGLIERDDSFINGIFLNDSTPTKLFYKNNKTKESSYSKIYLMELEDKRIMAEVDFQFNGSNESNLPDVDNNTNKENDNGTSTHRMTQRFTLSRSGKYKLANYSSSYGKSYFVYIKMSESK